MKKVITCILVLSMIFVLGGCKSSEYKEAMGLYENGDYNAAQTIFEKLGAYKDSAQMLKACYYEKAIAYAEANDFMMALEVMEKASGYQDSDMLVQEYKYAYAMELIGLIDQFYQPEIQENYNLKTIGQMFGMTQEYYDRHVTAYTLFEELVNSGYGKNTEYLLELVGRSLALEVIG